jgi:hypothetical protein
MFSSLTRFSCHTDTRGDLIAKGPRHCQARNIFVLEPHAQRSDRILIRISKGVDTAAALEHTSCLVRLTWLLVATDCLSLHFAIVELDNDTA